MTTENEKSPAPERASEAADSGAHPARESIVDARAAGGNGTSSKVRGADALTHEQVEAARIRFKQYVKDIEAGMRAKAPRLNQDEAYAVIAFSLFVACEDLKAERDEARALLAASPVEQPAIDEGRRILWGRSEYERLLDAMLRAQVQGWSGDHMAIAKNMLGCYPHPNVEQPAAAPCETCGGRGEVGGFVVTGFGEGGYDSAPCPDCSAAPAPADELATWDRARESLAVAMAGFAGRSGSRDFNAALIVLDAITGPRLPLSWLRTARAASARETAAEGAIVGAWRTDDGRAISAEQKAGMLRDGGAGASSVRPYSIPCYLGAPPAMAAEAVSIPKPVLDALRFYANGSHYHIDDDHQQFDTVSGEPQNWLMSERDDDCTMFEDGSIAKAALLGNGPVFEEPEEPVEGEIYAAPQPAQTAEASAEHFMGAGARKQFDDLMGENAELRGKLAAQADVRDDTHRFKNFHRQLCERFGYMHDEIDWRRDQVSLIEWIAKKADARERLTDERIIALAKQVTGWATHGQIPQEPFGHFYAGPHHQASVDNVLRIVRASLLAAHPGQPEPRIERLRKALFESRDAMRVMSNWVKKSDPAGHAWGVHMVDRANAALNGEPEPRAEVKDARETAIAVLKELRGRRGFDHLIDGIDDETRDEIVQEIASLIDAARAGGDHANG